MQTLELEFTWKQLVPQFLWRGGGACLTCCMGIVFALVLAGCSKEVAEQASDSDANGYLCLKCGVKLYTARSVFIGPACPKCQQDTLVEVVGYRCPKDQHLTIRSSREDSRGGAVCEQCQSPLVNAMVLPREKDLKAWGAVASTR